MKVYVIRCNDAVEGVVAGTEEFAEKKMEEMRQAVVAKHFKDYGEHTTRLMAPMFWRIHDFVLLTKGRDMVREALDNADSDGWPQKNEPVEHIVMDLLAYCDDLASYATGAEVVEHVGEWKKDKGYS